MKLLIISSLFFLILVPGCTPKSDIGIQDALVPQYSTDPVFRTIRALPPRPIVNAGKIYAYNNMLFQVEQDSGIHIINISNPASPVRLGFISSLLCKELSIKNNVLYTNNIADLVGIDISNLSLVRETSRVPNAFPDLALQYPAQKGVYFVCPDSKLGVVTGWKMEKVKNPQCRR